MPDHDVYTDHDTEHDPREPVVGHAHVDEDAVADPDAEPVNDESAVADGSATTYESAAHNSTDTNPDDSYVEEDRGDDTFGRAKSFGTEDTTPSTVATDTEYEGRQFTNETNDTGEDAEHDREADEATAGENGFGDRTPDDETFRERTTDDTTFDHEAHDTPVVTDTPGDTLVDHTTDEADVDDDTVVDNASTDDTLVNTSALDTETDADAERVDQEEALADGSAVDDPAVDHVTADDADSDATGLTYTGDVADLDTTNPDDTDTTTPEAEEAGLSAAPPVQAESQALKPGAVDSAPLGKLWADADVDGLKGRWRELQLKFIDDPQEVAGEAKTLVTEAVDALTAALNARKDALSEGETGDDTEQLRAAVRRYRDFFDQLLKL